MALRTGASGGSGGAIGLALRRLSNMKELLFTLAAIVAGWALLVETRDIHPIVLPPPWSVAKALVATPGRFLTEGFISFYEMMLGFAIGGTLGFALAILIFYSPQMRRALYPYIFAFRVVPKVAFVPLFLIWFGIGLTLKVILAATSVFFLVLVQTLLGLTSVDPALIELGHSLKMSEPLLLRRIRLPAALPAIMVGAKLGVTYALTIVVVAEMFVATNGLGFLVKDAERFRRTDTMLAIVFVVAVMGILTYSTARWVERRTTFWYVDDT